MIHSRMIASRLSVLGACLLIVVAGCTASTPASAPADTASARAAFESAWTAFHEGLRANDAEKVLAHMADDVVLMPPGEPVVRGKDAARKWFDGFLAQFRTASLTFADGERFIGNDSAVDLGTFEWTLTPVAAGDPVVDRGSYMQVWRRQPDGQWRFAREIWNSTTPATPPSK